MTDWFKADLTSLAFCWRLDRRDGVVLVKALAVTRQRAEQRPVAGPLFHQHELAVGQVADDFGFIADHFPAAAVEGDEPPRDLPAGATGGGVACCDALCAAAVLAAGATAAAETLPAIAGTWLAAAAVVAAACSAAGRA